MIFPIYIVMYVQTFAEKLLIIKYIAMYSWGN